MFGIALVLNFGSVAATNSTNTSLNSNNSTLDQNNISTTITKIAATSIAFTQSKTSVTIPVNTYNLSLAQIKDGLNRAQNYYINKDRLPNYVSYGTRKIPIATFQKILSSQGLKIDTWVTVKNLVYYHQTTGYTCGPSSLKMVFSNYRMNLTEMRLASYGRSNSKIGTTTAGMLNAVKDVNLKYGTKFKARDSSFTSVGWTGLERYIAHNEPVILHIKSFIDADSGHYVVLTGINFKSGLAKIADPNYGYRTISLHDLQYRINWTVSTGRTPTPLIYVT
jgi:predicted double-glycine peptidase